MNKKNWNTKSKPQRKTGIPLRIKVYAALFILGVIGVIYLLRLPNYQVKEVRVTGATLTNESDVTKVATDYLSYTYFYLIPQSNVWLYPKQKIQDEIRLLPSVDDAELDLVDRTLNISLSEKKHEFVWCNDSNCYYMNNEGYILAPSPKYEGDVFIVFRGLIIGDPLGKNFSTKEEMYRITSFIKGLKDQNLNVSEFNIVSDHEVKVLMSNKSVLIVSLYTDFNEVLKNIKTLSNSQEFMDATDGGVKNVKYLDMRYGKKAFWK